MKQLGKYFIFIGHMFVNREAFRTYVSLTVDECVQIGLNSIMLVTIVSTFMGAVTTIQSAYQLVSPLIADYIIAVVVRDTTILEFAPTITAIIFAGKVGSNIAGELGTMRISEQIDALEVMGINATSYLVLPKVIAALIVYPMLVVLAGTLSLLGGYWITLITGIISPEDYVMGLRDQMNDFAITFALIKAFFFAFIISTVSAFKGFYTAGGALEVGRASTSAVTTSVIAVLLTDYLLAELLLN